MSMTLDILSIDIDAALRKLTEKRFKSVDDPALVLIRFVASSLPRAIRVATGNRALTVETSAGEISSTPFHLLRILFDPSKPREDRSHALGELESSVGLDILAAFAGAPSRVTIAWREGDAMKGVRFTPGRRPLLFHPEVHGDFILKVEGGLPVKAEPQNVAEKCRFSEIPIFVNGNIVSHGIKVEGSLIRQKLVGKELRGVVGIPKEGDLSQITLLDHGIIADELYMPAQGGLVFHATVYGKRSDFQEFYPRLRNAAKRLLIPLSKGYPSLNRKRQRFAEVRLFDRYEVTKEESLVKGVYAFRTTSGRRMDIEAIMESSRKGTLFAIDETDKIDSFSVMNRNVIIVTRRQRRFLDTLLEQPIRTPPKRIAVTTEPEGLRRKLTRLMFALRGRLSQIPEARLTADERRFLEILNRTLRDSSPSGVTVAMVEGRHFPPCSAGASHPGRYLIPRHHPSTRILMADVLKDPAYIAPALALLSCPIADES